MTIELNLGDSLSSERVIFPTLSYESKESFSSSGDYSDYAVALYHLNEGVELVTFNDENSGYATSLIYAMANINGNLYDINGNHGSLENIDNYLDEEFYTSKFSIYQGNDALMTLRDVYGNEAFLSRDGFNEILDEKLLYAEASGDELTEIAYEELIDSLV